MVHAAVPVRGIAERWLTDDNWANFRSWAGHPDADQVIGDGSERVTHPRPELVGPTFRPILGRPGDGPPARTGADHGRLEHGGFALTEVQMTDSGNNVAGSWRYERLDGPGHSQLDAPEQVNALLLDFLPR